MLQLAADSDSIYAIAALVAAISGLVWVCRRDPKKEFEWVRSLASAAKSIFGRQEGGRVDPSAEGRELK